MKLFIIFLIIFLAAASAVENIPKACAYIYAGGFVICFIVAKQSFFENPKGYFLLPLCFVGVFLFFKFAAYVLTSDDKK